ncbi:relaxase/mobilization nuclease domain-containing protein [Siccirubricoccus phaeus]|uniref:relaxase/mobilization nuclease domain-containing protein n=1 Tax=Siccirubricoccus phaeus TaxID=2595053 RepID=UPI0011F14384|nr:relaxase/mobilization nuclease domain-containing protein [Siccirubricoccus phaeus]
MNFQIAGTGRSFKGAFAYYLHDKRQDPAAAHLATAERVAWMEVRNLVVDDPAAVQGVMIATARRAEQLKREAGGSAAGRKSKGEPVFAYSLQWHPENETIPDRAGMMAAVDATLAVIGAEGHQAAIIAHRDTAHPHVHVIVNRIDPETGKSLSLNKSADRLDLWAYRYERDRGEIVSPQRHAKWERHFKRTAKRDLERDFETAGKPLAEPAQARKPLAAPSPRPEPEKPPQAPESAKTPAPDRRPNPAPKSRAALLAEQQAAQKVRHKQEWRDLSAANKARRDAVFRERIDFKAIAAEHRKATRPLWSDFGKMQAAERRAFRERERRLSGIVRNAIDVVRSQQIRGVAEDRGFLSMCFAYTLNSQARAAAFSTRQQQEKTAFAATQDAALQAKFDAAKVVQARKLAEVRAAYDRERAELIVKQDLERSQIRERWRLIYTERDLLAAAQQRSRERMTRRDGQNFRHGRRLDRATWPRSIDSQARPSPGQTARVQQQEKAAVKSAFDRSADLAGAKQSPAAPTERVSVSVPAPAPAPEGVAVPPSREVRSVPADRPAAWAQTAAGQRATAPQKAAPDSLRRSFDKQPEQPRRPEWVAHAKDRPAGTPAPAKDWRTYAAPAGEQQKQPEARDWRQEQNNRPKPTTPPRGRFRDEWERDR